MKSCALLCSNLDWGHLCLHVCTSLFVIFGCLKEERFNFQTKVEIGVGKALADASQGILESNDDRTAATCDILRSVIWICLDLFFFSFFFKKKKC